MVVFALTHVLLSTPLKRIGGDLGVGYGRLGAVATLRSPAITITALGLYATAGVFFSLRLWLAATACAVTGTLWMVLMGQRLAYGGPAGRHERRV